MRRLSCTSLVAVKELKLSYHNSQRLQLESLPPIVEGPPKVNPPKGVLILGGAISRAKNYFQNRLNITIWPFIN